MKLLNAGKIAAIFTLAAALAGCGESASEAARKGPLIDEIVDNSMAACNTADARDVDADYETRLRKVLGTARSASLDVLIDNDITVCLDRRLADLDEGLWSTEIFGTYYKQDKVLTVWDNGLLDDNRGFLGHSNTSWSDDVIDELAEAITENKKSLREDVAFAGEHVVSTGKSVMTYIEWDKGSKFNYELERNPAIMTAPVAAPR